MRTPLHDVPRLLADDYAKSEPWEKHGWRWYPKMPRGGKAAFAFSDGSILFLREEDCDSRSHP
jgi:hypothetical protein